MQLHDLLAANAILPCLRAPTRKQVLLDISERAALVSGLPERDIFDALWQRESLGSTGIGDGVAIPHGKLQKAGRLFAVFARLDKPVDYDAVDGAPVDLVFALFAPEGAGADHLKALARIARTFRDENLVSALRATRDSAGIYALLAEDSTRSAA